MIRLLIPLAILFVFLTLIWDSSSESSANYRFLIADNKLFALRDEGYYGSELGLFSTKDNGDTWQEFNAPKGTRALCGMQEALFALTSDAQIHRKNSDKEVWNKIWSDNNKKYIYDIVCVGDAELFILASEEILVVSREGHFLEKYTMPGGTSCHKASMVDDRHLLVTCNPYRVVVVDIESGKLELWNEGFGTTPDDGLTGPARVKQHGKRFIVCHRNGVYVAESLMSKWEMLNDTYRHKGILGNTFCRDIQSYDSNDQWLVASDSGIHHMEGSTLKGLVFPDADDNHSLITGITRFNANYFVSFSRLKESIGVRLDGDLKSWKTLPTLE